MVPRIAVSGVTRAHPGHHELAGVNGAYVRSLVKAGAAPLILSPLMGAARAADALDGADALLLSGGEDLDPALYGAAASPHLGEVSTERDTFELALFEAARDRRLPILGICRGIQVINVACGGTLWQDLPTEHPGPVDHRPGLARNQRMHEVACTPGSRLAAILGTAPLGVNSFHHQAVRTLGHGLVATAHAPDGLVEGIEGTDDDGWLVGVQWHPEEMHAEVHAPEERLFGAFLEAARARRAAPAA
ncbi:MAG: gamma-glutamyl-gamma-aminobutyrate hydrolase family protein [Gemmatimonadales bacterium]|nr:gamma-glutamyl-gamma-aminobutyrate hydrolase family protein [Gemmatimonadales bacterium]